MANSSKALTLCTGCNTAFSGTRCPNCGKTVDSIYSESEIKEQLMGVVNQTFNCNFTMPSDVYTVETKPSPVLEKTFIRGLIGETNKIHAISGRFDTTVRLEDRGGYKGFFAWFLADKNATFEGALSTDVSVEPFDDSTDSQRLTINLTDCLNLSQAEFLKETPMLEDFLSTVCWALMRIFVTLADQNYYFPIPQDEQVFVEYRDNTVLGVKYVVLNDPKKYVGDIELAESRNINLFCNYMDSLFTRFCGKADSSTTATDVGAKSTDEMFGNLISTTNISPSNFEFSYTLYRLLMLIKGGKKIKIANSPQDIQEICTIKQFKAGLASMLGAGHSEFPLDFPFRPNRRATQKVFTKHFGTSYVCIKSFTDVGNSDIYYFSDSASNFLITALFSVEGDAENAHHFTTRLSQFIKEYILVKLFGGPALSTKSRTTTLFYSRLKAKLKANGVDFIETSLLHELVKKLEIEIASLNADAPFPVCPSFAVAFVFKKDASFHVVSARSGNVHLCLFDGKNKNPRVLHNQEGNPNVVYEKNKISTNGSVVVSTNSCVDNLTPKEIGEMLSFEGSTKPVVYNILFTSLLRGSSGNCGVFVLKPVK